jgi:hypothetical protein
MLHSPVVNLSCGNCKAIQSFSGDPPKCDVCGWVSGAVVKKSGREKDSPIVSLIVSALLVLFFLSNGPSMVWKYINRIQHHDKLTKIYHHGSWSLGEYQDCNSVNSEHEDTDPELTCGDLSSIDPGKTFMVRFSGDLTYDKDKQNGIVLRWRCRNDGDAEVTFSCFAVQETQTKKEAKTDSPTPTQQPLERGLTPAEIDDLRKRNECENLFTDKRIYEVDGMSVGAACKENPERRP